MRKGKVYANGKLPGLERLELAAGPRP